MKFGLTQKQTTILTGILKKYLFDGIVVVYGSRAKGNFTKRSDLDLVIKKSSNNDKQILADIIESLEDSDFPYLVDIQFFETIESTELINHINRVGKKFYLKRRFSGKY